MSSVRKSLALATVDNHLGLALQLVSTVVLARILTPQQTGVFAVAAVFASLASTFRDFGVSEFLIQERELDHDVLRAALTVNIAISWSMGLALFFSAPWIADFYREPGVRTVLCVLAFNFLLIPFGAVTMAWFRRELNFKPIVVTNVTASIVSFAVVVTLGLNGFGYMSLAWSSLAGAVASFITVSLFRPADFPRRPGLRGVGRVLHFGKFASSMYVFGQAGKGAPEMIIGRAQDMVAVGMFSRAYGIVELFNRLVLRSLNLVYLPYFARSVREEGTPRSGLRTAVSYLTVVAWPFLLFMSIAAYSAIRIVYGEQWLQAVPLAQVLCLAGAIEIVYFPAKEALLSQGCVKEGNKLQIIVQALRVLGLLAAVPFGLMGACWGLVAAALGGAFASHWYLARVSGWSLGELWQAARSSLLVTVIALAPVIALSQLFSVDEHNYLRFALSAGTLGTALWFAALRALKHPLWAEVVRMLGPLLHRATGETR